MALNNGTPSSQSQSVSSSPSPLSSSSFLSSFGSDHNAIRFSDRRLKCSFDLFSSCSFSEVHRPLSPAANFNKTKGLEIRLPENTHGLVKRLMILKWTFVSFLKIFKYICTLARACVCVCVCVCVCSKKRKKAMTKKNKSTRKTQNRWNNDADADDERMEERSEATMKKGGDQPHTHTHTHTHIRARAHTHTHTHTRKLPDYN